MTADGTLVLRDEAGREHRVKVVSSDAAVIADTSFTLKRASDGVVHVSGPASAMVWTAALGNQRWAFIDGHVFVFELERSTARRRGTAGHPGSLMAPMPATVRKLLVKVGDTVRENAVLIVLEAMKMELPVRAPADGRVQNVNCHEGQLVQPGVSLIDLEGCS